MFTILAVLLIVFQFNAGSIENVRTMQTWIFYGFVLVVVAVLALIFKVLWWNLPQAGIETKSLAEQVAQRQWYVKRVAMFERKIARQLDSKGWREIEFESPSVDAGGAVLGLASADRKREELRIAIRPGHPSVQILKRLTYLDIVEFEFLDKPLECALDMELCAYLVLKSSQT